MSGFKPHNPNNEGSNEGETLEITRVIVTDGSGKTIASPNITSGELNHLDNCSGNIETRLNTLEGLPMGGGYTEGDRPNIRIRYLHKNFTFKSSGGNFSVSHGLPFGVEVVGLTIGASYSGDDSDSRLFMPPGFTDSANFHYQAYVNSNSVSVRDVSSSNLNGRPGSLIIHYIV